ncbi:hypothetical protein [Mariniflexile sp. AS56]|uniref:hypothetical protein n=1 Tax=Mariniflexile sp. AS56 TaxID=3063957 RepID=UPI0026F02C24|nr:hypothetical protein [Mariniflexile sp. AS56]MDO7173212.1 hypothetical protein [Mariniflexile sp. AS56]
MIRLQLIPSILKSLNFNKKDKILEIEFKDGINSNKCMDIPISVLEDYITSITESGVLDTHPKHHSQLKIVHSNF